MHIKTPSNHTDLIHELIAIGGGGAITGAAIGSYLGLAIGLVVGVIFTLYNGTK